MSLVNQSSLSNGLLRALPRGVFDALSQRLEPVPLPLRTVLATAHIPIEHIYFLVDGVGSTVATTALGRRLEVGLFGREGMSGVFIVLGSDRTPYDTFMQVAGSALRISTAELAALVRSHEPLQALLLRYAQVMAVQTAHTALANGSFNVEERAARWMLMSHDRIDGDELPLTHEFLGIMLGVRRSSVTDAIHVLEGMNIIRATRGMIEVLDRARLEAVAGESYGAPEAEYARLIAPSGVEAATAKIHAV